MPPTSPAAWVGVEDGDVVCFRLTDHGLGHFLSACAHWGRLSDELGLQCIIDLRHHPIADSFVTSVWPAAALGWCEKLDTAHPSPALHGALPSSRSQFASYFSQHAISTGRGARQGRALVVGGPDLPNGPLEPCLPERWKQALHSLLQGAKPALRADAALLLGDRTVLHFRLGDRLSYGFSFQAEAIPTDAERALARCEALVKQHAAGPQAPCLVMSDCARLLSRLRHAHLPGVSCVDGTPSHCRAARDASGALSSLDTTVRDALVLLGAPSVLSFSCYAHGSLFARLLCNVGGGTYRIRPIFPAARARCAGTSRSKRRCARVAPKFTALGDGETWLCAQHRPAADDENQCDAEKDQIGASQIRPNMHEVLTFVPLEPTPELASSSLDAAAPVADCWSPELIV